jgi:hypothetical protein
MRPDVLRAGVPGMAMVCPKCSGSFEQRWQCPTCGVRLAYRSGPRPVIAESPSGPWGQTPWGRILVGVLLSQGLYYGLRQLCTAGLQLGGDAAAPGVWATLYGLIVLQALQALGLLVAGMLAGAGLRQGIVFGAIVGVWNGVLSAVIQGAAGVPHTAVTLLGQPILHTAFGAAGGFLGARIWKPLPTLAGPTSPQVGGTLIPAHARPPLFDGPIAWGRLLLGAALAVGGTIWANVILELVLNASQGALEITDHLQARLVTWEVTALAMLAGSALAGAGTANGLKQGLGVGLAVATVLFGFRLGVQQASLSDLVLTVACALALGLGGGWFGGSLFPPLVSLPRPKGLGPEAA